MLEKFILIAFAFPWIVGIAAMIYAALKLRKKFSRK